MTGVQTCALPILFCSSASWIDSSYKSRSGSVELVIWEISSASLALCVMLAGALEPSPGVLVSALRAKLACANMGSLSLDV
mgnify:CR=1 FL=1